LLKIPGYCEHNGHIFLIKVANLETRIRLMKFLRENEIETTFHYTPLHKSEFGIGAGSFIGEDKYTTRDSLRMLRLPLYHDISSTDQDKVISCIFSFFESGTK
jgi:dTDP-4-amino-4,6-dideoxygalactose transaminase